MPKETIIKVKTSGQIIKGVGGIYTVVTKEGEKVKCYPRGKLKQIGELFIGDIVDVSLDKEGIIEGVHKRKSQLVRPYVSNMDAIVIVLAPIPKPDMLLVDKLIIGATENNIQPIICINKADMEGADAVAQDVANDYKDIAECVKNSTIVHTMPLFYNIFQVIKTAFGGYDYNGISGQEIIAAARNYDIAVTVYNAYKKIVF